MQAILKGTCWLWFWAQLQCDDETKESFRLANIKLEIIALAKWKLIIYSVRHNFDISYFSDSSLISLKLYNNVNIVRSHSNPSHLSLERSYSFCQQ
jgi:hypothetical protein